MSKRKPIHAEYDAIVDFFPPEGVPDFAYGLVKFTYDIVKGRCQRGAVEPLHHDIRDPEVTPRWAPGSDFWPTKLETDVVVRGSAHGPGGRAVRSSKVRVMVGDQGKAIQVYGNRLVEWRARGNMKFGSPEPFTEMPITWANAYGGWDCRVPLGDEPPTLAGISRLEFDHPGVYPRNPWGRGYIVVNEPGDGIMLPNLEDPTRLLTPGNLVTGDPRAWFKQPLPACFEFTSAFMFPRFCWLGAEAWFHPPADARLPEVELGLLPPDFRALSGNLSDAPIVLQEGAVGLVFASVADGTPIIVEGMHPELPRLEFALPGAPRLEFIIEGEVSQVRPQLTNILIEPDFPRVSLTYVVRQPQMPRVFIPKIHAKIPLALRIDGRAVIAYDCPPTVREQRKAGPQKPP